MQEVSDLRKCKKTALCQKNNKKNKTEIKNVSSKNQ